MSINAKKTKSKETILKEYHALYNNSNSISNNENKRIPFSDPQFNLVHDPAKRAYFLRLSQTYKVMQSAADCGLHPNTIWHWRQEPEFSLLYDEALELGRNAIKEKYIGWLEGDAQNDNARLTTIAKIALLKSVAPEFRDNSQQAAGGTGPIQVTLHIPQRTYQVIEGEYKELKEGDTPE